MNYWLVKSDPDTYSWSDMEKEISTPWDGVRNYQARNNLKLMKIGDMVMFYHSQKDKCIIGLTKVTKEYFQDPTTKDDRWCAVQLDVIEKLNYPVELSKIKANKNLQNIALIKQSRLSVMPLKKLEFSRLLEISKSD